LSLPPEIRSRIYDYVFYVGVIHVTHELNQDIGIDQSPGYGLSLCLGQEVFETPTSRFSLSARRNQDEIPEYSILPLCMEAHRDCISTEHEPLQKHLRLDLLQTCRQIYHEAVLKPLSINTFHHYCDSEYFPGRQLQSLLKSLVPTQVRAIKHLRLVCGRANFLRHTTVQQLKGLENLAIQISWSGYLCSDFNGGMWKALDEFANENGIEELENLPLKSLRVTTEVESDHILSKNPDPGVVIAWQKRLESRLTGAAAMTGVSADDSVPIDSQAV
jgi:hypothetical protein